MKAALSMTLGSEDGVHQGFVLQRPGAIHHAQLLGNSKYALKILIMSNMYNLSLEDADECVCIMVYIVLIYLRHFLTCPLTTDSL